MACSHCGNTDHNIQTCRTVRRCGQCGRHGHDRRNCPSTPHVRPAPALRPVPPPRPTTSPSDHPPWDQIARLRDLCAREDELLAHLYWPENTGHFENSRNKHERGKGWQLKATQGHGVRVPEGVHSRPTLNFFVVDDAWVAAYAIAAKIRGIRHGLLLRRAAVELLESRPGFDFEKKITVRYPNKDEVLDPANFWRFDIGNHRFKALDAMSHATVVRLATPLEAEARFIELPTESVVSWW